MNKKPLVSVCCLTYNHSKFIRECFEGFLMQKTSFSFEVLIHDDASTDGTKEIIEEYTNKHPDIFFPKYQKENQYSKGVRGIMARYNFPRAQGKYIAMCEGDDYWTDPLKLQKQVDFLEANDQFAGCYHNTFVVNETNGKQYLFRKNKDSYNAEDTLSTWSLFHTSSFMFKKKCFVYENFLNYSFSGDMALFSIISLSGLLGKVDGTMSVYRKNNGGITSGDAVFNTTFYINRLALLGYLNQLHNLKYDAKYKKSVNELLQSYRYDIEKKSQITSDFSYFSIMQILKKKVLKNIKKLVYGKQK